MRSKRAEMEIPRGRFVKLSELIVTFGRPGPSQDSIQRRILAREMELTEPVILLVPISIDCLAVWDDNERPLDWREA